MPLFRFSKAPKGSLTSIPTTTFIEQGILEEAHLRGAFRDQIDALTPRLGELLVIAEEYSKWEDCRREIDLLAVDRSGALVVVELKRGHEKGHAELQALRYAAMVSAMTFNEAVEALRAHRIKLGLLEAAGRCEQDLADHIESENGDGENTDRDPRANFGHTVRIILVAVDFSRELTGTVLWLRAQSDIDISCFRMTPYLLEKEILVDVEQIIPLPEEGDFRVRLATKEREERKARQTRSTSRPLFQLFDGERQLLPNPIKQRQLFFEVLKHLLDRGQTPESLSAHLVNPSLWFLCEGTPTPDEIRAKIVAAFPGDKNCVRRYYTEEAQLVRRGGKTYALKNQDAPLQLPKLEQLAKKIGLSWQEIDQATAEDDDTPTESNA